MQIIGSILPKNLSMHPLETVQAKNAHVVVPAVLPNKTPTNNYLPYFTQLKRTRPFFQCLACSFE